MVLNGMPIFSAVFWADSLIALSVFMRIVVFVKFIYYSIYIGINMSRTINKHYGKARPCRRVIIKHGVPRICVKISMVSPDHPSLEIDFCLKNLKSGLETAIPEIHNSDQGSQFTSAQYTDILKDKGVNISMDGLGRCMDNIFTERFWRTLKYEEVYLKSYGNINEAEENINRYIKWYNDERKHSSLNKRTPAEIYFGKEFKKENDVSLKINLPTLSDIFKITV